MSGSVACVLDEGKAENDKDAMKCMKVNRDPVTNHLRILHEGTRFGKSFPKSSLDGKIMNIYKPGATFGEGALLRPSDTRCFSVMTLQDSVLLRVDLNAYNYFIEK